MTELLFHYIGDDTAIHRIDPRIKLVALIGNGTAVMAVSPFGLIPLLALCIVSCVSSGLRLRNIIREGRAFLLLIAAIVFLSVVTADSVTQGAVFGGIYSLRLLLVLIFGHLFISTTTVREIRGSVAGLLKPLPFRWTTHLATIIGLVVSFLPVLFDITSATVRALKTRSTAIRRRPFRYTRLLVQSLSVRAFLRVDVKTKAIDARGYTGGAPAGLAPVRRRDLIVLGAVIAVIALSVVLSAVLPHAPLQSPSG